MAEPEKPPHATSADEAVATTASVFHEMADALKSDHPVSAEQLRAWKRQIGRANKAIARAIRSSWLAQDRLTIELELLKAEAKKERLDRDANVARVFEKLRSYSTIGPADVDRCIGASANVQKMLASLAPILPESSTGTRFLAQDMETNDDGLKRLVSA